MPSTHHPVHRRYSSDPIISNSRIMETPVPETKHEFSGGDGDALAPLGINFIDNKGVLAWDNVSEEDRERADRHLIEKFGVYEVFRCEPFLVMAFDSQVPSPGHLPYSVGGFVPVWRPDGDTDFWPDLGYNGAGEAVSVGDLYNDWDYVQGPSEEQMTILANKLFPTCEAITFFWGDLVVELPKASEEAFRARLKTLPRMFDGLPYGVQWHNGPLASQETVRRTKTPDPSELIKLKNEAGNRYEVCKVEDDTDYLATQGRIFPGVMVSSLTQSGDAYSQISAGILVKKDDELRVTVSYHNWAKPISDYPGLLGVDSAHAREVFGAGQGDPGTPFGHLTGRIGETDIALLKLDEGVVFENRFMEFDAVPKELVKFAQVQRADTYVFDGCTTGKQFLRFLGTRAVKTRPCRYHGEDVRGGETYEPGTIPSDDVAYLRFGQGLYATTTPVMGEPPHICDRAYGSVLVRARIAKTPQIKEATVLATGKVAAMFHFADVVPKYAESAKDLVCMADSLDPLIEDGWAIVHNSDKKDDKNNNNVVP
ncbi:hypothetical protein QBC44DRAFT_228647 [Cladorrhinum sp. PSN332]|nr:hypothetical protein QBC44DRAFT_228647 [Cladorrhinum sp. PSN332]